MRIEHTNDMGIGFMDDVLYVFGGGLTCLHICPCKKCNTLIGVNLQPLGTTITLDEETITVSEPFKNDCGSHYYIRNGEVEWV